MIRDPQTFEYYIVRLIIIGGVLIFGFLGSKLISAVYYNRLFDHLSQSARAMDSQFQEKIASGEDSFQLCKWGISFYQSDKNDLALEAFKKATEIDNTYRDAWVWRGYLELKLHQEDQALESLKKAEEIDPTYPLTYQLLSVAYQQTGNNDASQQAQEKYEYLSK